MQIQRDNNSKSSSHSQVLLLTSMPEHSLSSFLLKLSLASSLYRPNSSLPSPAKMKNKAAIFFKQVTAAVAVILRSKYDALKNKAIAMRTRLVIFRLLHNKKVLLSALSTKMHSLMLKEFKLGETSSQSIVLFNEAKVEECPNRRHIEAVEYDEGDAYPDLRHTLFELQDEEQEIDDGLLNSTASVVDWVRNTRDDGSEFNLEDEIDQVADIFIKRFRWQMMLEKQESIKRYRQMSEGSV